MREPATPGTKKAYVPPVLTVYGTVRDLTQTVGHHNSPDGPSGIKHRTTL